MRRVAVLSTEGDRAAASAARAAGDRPRRKRMRRNERRAHAAYGWSLPINKASAAPVRRGDLRRHQHVRSATGVSLLNHVAS
jgi:hypothetical protein